MTTALLIVAVFLAAMFFLGVVLFIYACITAETEPEQGVQITHYCYGNRCALREYCRRYVEGGRIPKDATGYWWMQDFGEQRQGFIEEGGRR